MIPLHIHVLCGFPFHNTVGGHRGRDRMVIGFTTPMQSVPITTEVSLKPAHDKVYLIHYVIVCQRLVVGWCFSVYRYSGFLHQ